jgi:hypothetical protein
MTISKKILSITESILLIIPKSDGLNCLWNNHKDRLGGGITLLWNNHKDRLSGGISLL